MTSQKDKSCIEWQQIHKTKKDFKICLGGLTGSVSTACDSQPQDCKFKPQVECRDYLKITLEKNKTCPVFLMRVAGGGKKEKALKSFQVPQLKITLNSLMMLRSVKGMGYSL